MNRSEAAELGYQAAKEKLKTYLEKRRERFIEIYEANPKFCVFCGKQISFERKRNRFCGKSCATAYQNCAKVTSTEVARTDRARKRILIDLRGHKCESCGLSEWNSKPIPLEIHHVDGNTENNAVDNLSLLCPNCHAITSNYKRANTGRQAGRQKTRRKMD